ncbi:MAG: D-alanyl-D-alanine dipeptidase [Proteobacteria bacterium]|nr:D-alanyl-D-alanine dipeptidase [Pseudomonadota bacterium]
MQADIAQLLPIIKRKGETLVRPWQRFAIQECGEPLVSLEAMGCFTFQDPAPYAAVGAPYGDMGPYYLRQGVAERLRRAQDNLNKLLPGWHIRIFDGLRPLAVQEYMVAYSFAEHARAKRLDPLTVEGKQKDNLLDEVYRFWSPANDDPAAPPPHSTGAAFDCTLEDDSGSELPMGSPIDFIGEESKPEFFAEAGDMPQRGYDNARRMLHNLLAAQGFARHPGEWWHFSYGDQMWAWQNAERGESVQAIYGKAQGG